MEDYGLVTVICPMYNSSEFVKETIESVLNQTYQNFEMIIVDDLSTDNSTEIVKKYDDKRIILLSNEKNSGAAESRNKALRHAKGKWIAFLDSDDLWYPDKLEKQLEFMVKNNIHFSFTNYIEIDEHSKEIGKRVTAPKVVTKHKMKNFCYLGCLTVIYDAEFIGLIQIDERIKKRNDYAIWLKCVKKCNAYNLPMDLAKYRRHSGSISNVSFKKLLKAHYVLFRISEKKCRIASLLLVIRNCFYGYLKKKKYVKKY